MIRPIASSPNHVWTDASGNFGCGAFVPSSQEWCQLQWPNSYPPEWVHLKDESIALKELLPIVLACAVWGSDWENQTVSVHCDNLGVVSLVNSGYSRVPQIMHLLRCLFFIRAHFHLDVWAIHVPGVQNSLADALSRNNLHIFLLQVPGAASRRRSIPPDLLDLLVGRQPDWTSPAWSQLFARSFLRELPRQPERTTSQEPGATSPSATCSVSIPHSRSQRRV